MGGDLAKYEGFVVKYWTAIFKQAIDLKNDVVIRWAWFAYRRICKVHS